MSGLGKLLDFTTSFHTERNESDHNTFRSNLDPELIDHILGKDDAVLMKEAMSVICNPNESLENRKTAFENLEMLVEDIYNAKNLANMNMWEPLIQQLSSPEPIIRMHAASVCGTAVQNNFDSQEHFLNNRGFEKVLALFNSDDDPHVRLKSFYAIASEVRNNLSALEEFYKFDGWSILVKYLKDDNYTVLQRKILFFIWTLLLQDTGVDLVIEHIKLNQLQKILVEIIQRKEIQNNALEEVLGSISLLHKKSSIFNMNELMIIKNIIKFIKEKRDFEVISEDSINEISVQFGVI
ncbi:hypothetical protein T552_02361 [Pneumocystis carinii B80]|uniref:Nucleotide exchange factor Fes1 domain-containing protein n=1 Tax=Pneumocystis carinii (strain B80) TaxID=1408658 RepID=A0A0W4ZG97_PNEC8|nr:hypothetical protein T552_02361 [Pneumocystis carinii B80]KTW27382.1 hypothetical protein T552_02361 [Pneumocystis carinii B80]